MDDGITSAALIIIRTLVMAHDNDVKVHITPSPPNIIDGTTLHGIGFKLTADDVDANSLFEPRTFASLQSLANVMAEHTAIWNPAVSLTQGGRELYFTWRA